MKGLWSIPTQTINPNIGATTFDTALLVVAVICTVISFLRPSKQWADVRNLQISLLLISIWAFLNWINMVIRSQHGSVQYGYIVIQPIFKIFRVLSEVFSIWGLWNVKNRHMSFRRTKENARQYAIPYFGAFILLVLSLYHTCFFFATSIAWLSFDDLSTIDSLAFYSSAFEVAYTTTCFILMLMINAVVTLPVIFHYIFHKVSPNYKAELAAWSLAVVALTIRSFCEVIIVGQLNRWPADIASIYDAREITYSIITILFLCLVPYSIPHKKDPDPLVEKEKEFNKNKAAAQLKAKDGVSTWFLQEMAKVTESGTKTAPTVSALLNRLEGQLNKQPIEDDIYDTLEVKKEEIERIRDIYADWEPIFRDYRDYPPDEDCVDSNYADGVEGIP